MTLEEIRLRKAALQSTIDSFQKHIKPLEKEMKELEKLEAEIKKEKNDKDGV